MNQEPPKSSEKYRIVVQWNAEEKCFVATAAELGNCMCRGASKVEALELCEKAIDNFIVGLTKQGHPIPVPFSDRKFSGKLSLRIDPLLHRDVAANAESEALSINQYIEKRLREAK